jgi:arylsulfatase A-like enzyme
MIADDMRFDDVARTPALADLAAAGTSFTRAFAGFPLCTPARATMLTGQLPRVHGVRANSDAATFDASSTWTTWLHDAGYETHLVGKYLNRLRTIPQPVPGWDDFRAMPKHTTYGREQSDVLAEQAADVIATAAEPFALVVGFASPHGPQPGPHRFDGAVPPPLDIGPALDPAVAGQATREWNRRWRGLQGVSDAVDTVRAALDARGITGRTLVVFTSDQGYALGEFGAFGKMDWHEWVLRVPLIVAGPGVPTGDVRRGIVSHADLAPTFAVAGGVEPPAGLYGRPLQPILGADRDDWRNRVDVDGPGWSAIRRMQSKVVRFDDGREVRVDLVADPRELAPVEVAP